MMTLFSEKLRALAPTPPPAAFVRKGGRSACAAGKCVSRPLGNRGVWHSVVERQTIMLRLAVVSGSRTGESR